MSRYQVTYAFTAENAEELGAQAGEIVIALEAPMDGWVHCKKELNPSLEGFIPLSYLKPAPVVAAAAPIVAPPAVPSSYGTSYGGYNPSTVPNMQTYGSGYSVPAAVATTATAAPANYSAPQAFPAMQTYGSSGAVPAMQTYGSSGAVPAMQSYGSTTQAPAMQSYGSTTQAPAAVPAYNSNLQSFSSSTASLGAQAASIAANKPPPSAALTQPVGNSGFVPPPLRSAPSIDRNAQNFDQTLELWRERERRFTKGEKEKLPKAGPRQYYYWDRQGHRIGPLSEQEMKARFSARQFGGDTLISLAHVDSNVVAPRPIQEAFPGMQMAFETAPTVQPNSMMWNYVDDMNVIQGPFTAQQMRDWFQQGYFNAETKARLADKTSTPYAPLGLIFPEGVGAFLSEGDQAAAQVFNPVAPMMNPPPMVPANSNPFDVPGQRLSYVPTNGPDLTQQYYATQGYPQQQNAWGQPAATATPFDFGDLSVLDSDSQQGTAGRALLFSALSDQKAAGPPPPSQQATTFTVQAIPTSSAKQDDWGISWDDEADETTAPSHRMSHQESAVPLPVTATEVEDKDTKKDETLKVAKLDEIKKLYLNDTEALYKFLTRPVPKDLGTVRCQIRRSLVGLHVNYNIYELYLEDENGQLGPQILIANKYKVMFDSYFWISIGSVLSREAGTVICSLIMNTVGTNWVLHNNVKSHRGAPRDLCVLNYQSNIGKGPRKMQVALPGFKDEKNGILYEWAHGGSTKKSTMLQALTSLNLTELQPLVNKPPTWSKKHSAWTLNFHGRVTRPSVKNFQLCRPEDLDHIVLQHGRVGGDSFTMDMSYPITPVAAFAICISSLHAKLMVE